MKLGIKNVEHCISSAKENGFKFIAIALQMPKYQDVEVEVIRNVDFDKKLEYIKENFNGDLTMKDKPLIKIVGFTHCNSYDEIETCLIKDFINDGNY